MLIRVTIINPKRPADPPETNAVNEVSTDRHTKRVKNNNFLPQRPSKEKRKGTYLCFFTYDNSGSVGTNASSTVRFSSVPLPIGLSEGHEGRLSRDHLPDLSAGGPCEQFWHGHGCLVFDVVHPTFPLPTTASFILKGTLKDVLERLSWRVTCPYHASFRLLTVARRGSCGPTKKLISLHAQSLVLCSKKEL